MTPPCESCPIEKVHQVEYRALNESLREVKDRVSRLETTITRGFVLLVANLMGMVMTLAREFIVG